MRRRTVFLIRVGYLAGTAVLASMLYPALQPARSYSGPSPRACFLYNLQAIEVAKERLKDQWNLTNGYLPTEAEIATAYSGEKNAGLDRILCHKRWGDAYIINCIGVPAYVYLSNSTSGLPGGVKLSAGFIESDSEKWRQPEGARGGTSTNQPVPEVNSQR